MLGRDPEPSKEEVGDGEEEAPRPAGLIRLELRYQNSGSDQQGQYFIELFKRPSQSSHLNHSNNSNEIKCIICILKITDRNRLTDNKFIFVKMCSLYSVSVLVLVGLLVLNRGPDLIRI